MATLGGGGGGGTADGWVGLGGAGSRGACEAQGDCGGATTSSPAVGGLRLLAAAESSSQYAPDRDPR
nr:unnamed protein product [Digitaria exilis]